MKRDPDACPWFLRLVLVAVLAAGCGVGAAGVAELGFNAAWQVAGAAVCLIILWLSLPLVVFMSLVARPPDGASAREMLRDPTFWKDGVKIMLLWPIAILLGLSPFED